MKQIFIILAVFLLVSCGGQKPAPQKTYQPAPMETTAQTQPPTPVVESQTPPAKPQTPASVEPKKPTKENTPSVPEQPSLPKLWDFFATWCPPCKQQAPIIEELAAEYKGQIEILSIDTDKEKELARRFNIQAIPTLVFLDPSGKELSRRIGFFPKDSIVSRFKLHGFIK